VREDEENATGPPAQALAGRRRRHSHNVKISLMERSGMVQSTERGGAGGEEWRPPSRHPRDPTQRKRRSLLCKCEEDNAQGCVGGVLLAA
jgi:hypothetical protein